MIAQIASGHRSLAFSLAIISAALLLLYGWSLTESTPLQVQVEEGRCTAVLGERSSGIPCSGLAGGRTGLYLTYTPPAARIWTRPLDLFVPAARWQRATMATKAGSRQEPLELALAQSRRQGAGPRGALHLWPSPSAGAFDVGARVLRPDGELAGVVLLQPQSDDGWAFIVDSENRQGVWWRWQDGQRGHGISGVPYQKPLVAQLQSLLRQILATFLGALLIMAAVAATTWLLRRLARLFSTGSGLAASPVADQLAGLPNSFTILPIILAVFGLSLWIALDLLEGVPHVQDSITFLFQAQTLAGGALWAAAPPLPDAFAQEFLMVADGKWFGQYPPGFAALLALGVRAGAPWLINPWLAVATTVLLYRLGYLLFGRMAGFLSALLALLSPFFLFLSGSLMVHTAELFWTALLMVSWTLALRVPLRLRRALLSGMTLGMLFLTRQVTAVVIGASFVGGLLLVEGWSRRVSLASLSRQGIVLLAGTAPFVLLLLGYQAALMGSPWEDPRLLGRPFDRPGFGPDIGEPQNVFSLQEIAGDAAVTWYTDPSQPPRGHSLARGLYNTEQNVEALAGQLFGWFPLFALAFCWLPFLLARSGRYDWLFLAVLVAVLLVYVSYWTTGIMYGPRYYFAALPALLLLTALGLQALAKTWGGAGTALVLAAILLLALSTYWPRALREMRGYNFIDGADRAFVEEQLSGPALVFVPVQHWWDYGRFFSGNTPWLDGEIIYARDLGPAQNRCLQEAFPGRASYLWRPEEGLVAPVTWGEQACTPGSDRQPASPT